MISIRHVVYWGGANLMVGNVQLESDTPIIRLNPRGVRGDFSRPLECFAQGWLAAEFIAEGQLQQPREFMGGNPDGANTARTSVLEDNPGESRVNRQAMMELLTEMLTRLPHTGFAGPDVAMTEDGPTLIEANMAPERDGSAHANIPSLLIWKKAWEYHGC